MAFQMPAWRAPGVSLNYVPTKQQIGSPQNNMNLDAMLKNLAPKLASILTPAPAPAAAAPVVDPRTAQLANEYRDSRWASGGRDGSHAGFSGTQGAGGFGGRFGGGPGNRGGGLY